MKTAQKDALASNLKTLLTAVAEIAIEEELSHSEFDEIARFAFVQAAQQVLKGEKRISDSRISIVTGIHRKDVKRLREHTQASFKPEKARTNRAISVISAWAREKDYTAKDGTPLPLPFDEDTPCLSGLIKQYSGDMPVRAVCKELERMGVIKEQDDRWHLIIPAFVPNKSREIVFDFLGEDTSQLVHTIHHNLNQAPDARRFQRKVAYDELSPESAALFQAFASERAMDLLKEFDTWLSEREKHDKQQRKTTPEIPHTKSGIGIYYFEETLADTPDGDEI